MRRLLVALIASLVLVGCESRSGKLEQCRATCDELDGEYRAQCSGPDVEGCLHNVEEHHQACLRICDMEASSH